MPLPEFLTALDDLERDAVASFSAAGDAAGLEAARIEFLGAKGGRLREIQAGLGQVEKSDKPAAGKRLNEVKARLESAFGEAQARVKAGQTARQSAAFDATLPGRRLRLGHLHPVTQTIERMKEIMGRLGFTAVEGPEVEDEWHNFEALNIPLSHPARDPLDNFYLSVGGVTPTPQPLSPSRGRGSKREAAEAGSGDNPGSGAMLLRSQTSTVQIRVMEKTPPPVRIISLGRVYRPDTPDATHYPMFHQIEGLYVDRHVTMADLKSVLRLFCTSYFHEQVHIRFRPSFFPFTEPSVEVDMSWKDGWIEMGGAGMVDPHVLTAVGYDPDQVSGFAFGLGVERICLRQHGISDIRLLYENDVRFLRQF
jgi:phenylalanyl-tRNA synthetase alpha chain